MVRLVVRNITNTKIPTKKPTSVLAEIRRKRRYFDFSTVLSNYILFVVVHKYYKSLLFMDISAVSEPILIKQRWFLSFKLHVLSNLTLSFSLSHNKLFCVAPSATELNYPFNQPRIELNWIELIPIMWTMTMLNIYVIHIMQLWNAFVMVVNLYINVKTKFKILGLVGISMCQSSTLLLVRLTYSGLKLTKTDRDCFFLTKEEGHCTIHNMLSVS